MSLESFRWTVDNRASWDVPALLVVMSHRCVMCLERWPSPESLARHVRSEDCGRQWECSNPDCCATFAHEKSMWHHMNSQDCPRQKPTLLAQNRCCYLCQVEFSRGTAYSRHIQTPACQLRTNRLLNAVPSLSNENRREWDVASLKNLMIFRCERCLERWPSKDSLARHQHLQSSMCIQRWKCSNDQCVATFKNKDLIKRHQRTACPKRQPSLEDPKQSCYLCEHEFKGIPSYQRHLESPECQDRTKRFLDALDEDRSIVR